MIDPSKVSPTFTTDVLVLVNTWSEYVSAIIAKTAGTKPNPKSGTVTIVFSNKAQELASVALVKFLRTYAFPLNPNVNFTTSPSSFSKKFVSIDYWNNIFFTIRTQSISDPAAVAVLDYTWEQIQLIKGTWKITNDKNRTIR
jgi:hypothetical protein